MRLFQLLGMSTKFLCWHCTHGGVSVAWRVVGNAGRCCCTIPPGPPDSCSSTSQIHSSSFPQLRNILFPNSIFCEGMMLKAGSIPLSPDPSPTTDLVVLLAILRTQKWTPPSLFLKTWVILTLLALCLLYNQLHRFQNITIKLNYVFQLQLICLKKKNLRSTVTAFSGMLTSAIL